MKFEPFVAAGSCKSAANFTKCARFCYCIFVAGAEAGALYTIGHSTRSIEDFLGLLQHYEIRQLIDIRSVPRSRHNPQFGQDTLAQALRGGGMEYRHMKDLGGLRHPLKHSLNAGWHNPSFRGFADYMQTPEFARALMALVELSKEKRTVIMCAEAVPWRCHRSLIGDALVARGVKVCDIFSATSVKPHHLTEFARVDGLRVTYP